MLKHKEFVSQIQILNEKRLVSASGDSNLILWDLSDFKCMQEINVKSFYNTDDYSEDLNGIDKFLKNNELRIKILQKGYQVWIEKL